MTTLEDTGLRITRRATMRWIPIADMAVSPVAQRDYNPAHANKIAANLDPDKLGHPTVNLRARKWMVVDGQHRVRALEIRGMGNMQLECEAYEGLTEPEEGDLFLQLNDRLGVGAYQKFKIAVTAGRVQECAINDIVISCGMRIGLDSKSEGTISAVRTLEEIYKKGGEECLARTLVIVKDSYGYAGLDHHVIGGVGLMMQRYGTVLDDARAIAGLQVAAGGSYGLLEKARGLKRQFGKPLKTCVAAAATETINAGRGGKKLPDWWRAGNGTRRTRETPQAVLADAV